MPVELTISQTAIDTLKAALPAPDTAIRLTISERFEHDLSFATAASGDETVTIDGITIVVDPGSASRCNGVKIDYVDGPQGGGFTIDNPNQPPRVVQLSVLEFKAMRQARQAFELVDVRTPGERDIAAIEGSRLLDEAYHKDLLRMDRDTALVFQCHHGVRSQAAAEYFVQAGFRKVYNLRGGIDAWSQLVDPTVPRY